MPFQFSMEPVLEHRRALEDKAQREYGAAVARLEATRGRKRDIETELESRKQQVRREQQQALPYIMRELIENWIVSLEQHLREVDLEAKRQAVQTEQMRLRLVKAMQNRTVMEKLRDKEMSDFKVTEERSERRRFDEIAIRNYAMERRQEKFAELEAEPTERIAG